MHNRNFLLKIREISTVSYGNFYSVTTLLILGQQYNEGSSSGMTRTKSVKAKMKKFKNFVRGKESENQQNQFGDPTDFMDYYYENYPETEHR